MDVYGINRLRPRFSLPDFSHKKLVEQEAQGEEDQALDERGDEHPAKCVCGEWVLIGINAIATEDLDLYVHPSQVHQPVPKVELGENLEGMAQPLEDVLDYLQEERTKQEALRNCIVIFTFLSLEMQGMFALLSPL